MVYQDKIYGQALIDEPVILELINSYELQRLKEISLAGYFEPYHPGSKHTRFEHSVGVYLLLRKFGAPIEEQVSGLIHDVSHSAFSHAVDYALSEGSEKEQNHQDNYFTEYVLNSSIPKILEKYGFDAGYIMDEKNFPLLENQLPDLCADRIDYSLRGLLAYKVADMGKIGNILENFIVQDGKWIIKDFDLAYGYAQLFHILNDNYYSGITSAVMFRRLGDYLRYALDMGYVTKDDLYTTDDEVIGKINRRLAGDARLASLWKNLNNSQGYENNPDDYDAEVYCKSRVIDPLCRYGGGIKRVSDIEPGWKDEIKRELQPKRYLIKFFD
ncbi:MAG: HD domain-containing protein [Parcubacteria group bacterium]